MPSPIFGNLDAVRKRHADALEKSGRTRTRTIGITAAFVLVTLASIAMLDLSLARFGQGFSRLGSFAMLMLPPAYGTEAKLALYLKALAETLAIALLGTLVAAVAAFPLAFLGARNIVASRILQFATRRFFDTIRSVDALIWALIWINVVGLGPFAGILAIATSDFGTFGKLFSEAIETADAKTVEGVTAAGGGAAHRVCFGVLPQVLPVLASQLLYYFESNTRSATIIGIVGAGGIGLHLVEEIRTLEWRHVSFLVLLILAIVALIDALSRRLRLAVIGERPR